MAASGTIDQERVRSLADASSGMLVLPDDDAYDAARTIHNASIDRRPALIVRCLGTADVVAAVAFARESGLEVSVRRGGHNVAGRAVSDGGVMIDLSLMKGIHVDPRARTARAQGGTTWREFNRETAVHGLATTGGLISTTGVAGLTLGGGIGWLMGVHGLSVDNLLSVELVTAGGEVLTASADENPDLLWGLRGGGGNFGVAVSFECGCTLANAVQQAANVRGAFAIIDTPPPGTGLLVDDRRLSGWTMAMVGGQLRRAGAETIVPLALGSLV